MSGAPAGRDDPDDPQGLIRESYRIDGITLAECRTVFLDWALSLPSGIDTAAASARLLEGRPADHPMTTVLTEGSQAAPVFPARRGGSRGRARD